MSVSRDELIDMLIQKNADNQELLDENIRLKAKLESIIRLIALE